MHLAELNIARPRFPLDDPRMVDFVDNLDRVNAVAERSPGFVWRLKGDGNDATDIRFDDDPDSIVNMSVWETAEHLEHFVWNTVHKHIYRRRGEWFPSFGKPYFVMWYVPVGHEPTLAEAKARLDHLAANGSNSYSFGWEGLPNLRRWMEERCA
jgi:heme-degrading monooxygenase HmoA